MKILDLASPRFHKKERHGNEKKERKEKKMEKGKFKIKRTQRSPKKIDSKSLRKKRERKKIESKDCHDLWKKETYGEERKIENSKGVFLPQKPQNTIHLHLLIRLYDLFLLRSRF